MRVATALVIFMIGMVALSHANPTEGEDRPEENEYIYGLEEADENDQYSRSAQYYMSGLEEADHEDEPGTEKDPKPFYDGNYAWGLEEPEENEDQYSRSAQYYMSGLEEPEENQMKLALKKSDLLGGRG